VPEIGITGTPVIDGGSGTIYLVAKTKEGGTYIQRLHALNVGNGAEKFGGPVMIQASVAGTGDGNDGAGHVPFNPLRQHQRPGLLLSNGVVYISWASHGDNGPYHGWVIGYNATTLAQAGVYCTTPNGGLGGIWMSGGGPAADSSGNLFVITGNGTFQAGSDYGDSYIRLSASGGGLAYSDSFTPFNQQDLSNGDLDLGSGGALLLPDQPGTHPHLMVSAGKEGKIYLVDRDTLGGFNANSDNVVQELPGALPGLFGTPAYFGGRVYFKGTGGPLVAYTLSNGLLQSPPALQSGISWSWPGSTPSISANGSSGGIVWAIESNVNPGVLHAFDATNLSNELYNSNQNSGDQPGFGVKFTVPTVAAGKVYVGTSTGLAVYGLKGGPGAAAVAINSGGGAAGSFVADTDFSGGNNATTGQGVDTSAVSNPAPLAVYQSERWGVFSYAIPGLTPGGPYTVRLHFAEIFWSSSGQRVFNVAINGATVLSNFDIVAAAGAAFKAVVREFSVQADPGGRITIAYSQGPADQPKSSGIEILAAGTAGPLPPPWTDADIGAVGIPGSASFAAATGTFTIQASGDDIWNTADGFHFVYQPLNGDGALLARVASVGNTDSWAKAGVMIRETVAANSTQAMMAITPGNGSAFQRRTSTGGSSTHTAGPAVTAPYWVKIERSGTTFTGSVSADGSSWTVVGSDTISMAGTVWIGLAVTAHNNGLLNTSTFDHVSLSSGGGSPGGVAIDAGGPAAGAFTADQAFSGGTVSSGTSSAIDTSGVAGPAPQIVYQTGRFGNFSYTPGGLTAGAPYRVRLHFAEYIHSASGQRVFNVAINGASVLTNFDIFQAAGSMNKALVREFNATASGGGSITIAFTSVVDNSIVQGLEIVPQAVAIAVNAGGGAAGAFEADTSFSGGSVSRGTTAAIDTSGVSSPAPQAVYQTGRFGNFSYSFSGLAPGGTVQVRLHFAEYIYSSSGSRVFNVAINGTSELSNFDIFAAAGAMNKAVVRTFTVTADSSGGIVISFTSVVDNSILQGLELQSP
jgi:hypothetical protein